MLTTQALQKRIQTAYKRLHNWRAVASEFGANVGTIYRIAQGYEPKDAKIRHALHLPAYAPAPVCARCGIVHVSKRCTAKRQLPEPWEGATRWLAEREADKTGKNQIDILTPKVKL